MFFDFGTRAATDAAASSLAAIVTELAGANIRTTFIL
jgi:hypothetical protein